MFCPGLPLGGQNQIFPDLVFTAPYVDMNVDTVKTFGVLGAKRYIRVEWTTASYANTTNLSIMANNGVEVAPGDS